MGHEESLKVLDQAHEKQVMFADDVIPTLPQSDQRAETSALQAITNKETSPVSELDSDIVQPNLLQRLKRSGDITYGSPGSDSAL